MHRVATVVLAVLMLSATTCGANPSLADVLQPRELPRILVFSYSTGWRHDSIPAAIDALRSLGDRAGYVVETSEDPGIFTAGRLEEYDLLVLLNSTSAGPGESPDGLWFDGPRAAALQAFVRAGNGIVGVHGASDSHDEWRWYGQMIGGRFDRHPHGTPPGRLTVRNADHPATAGLPLEFERVDEWYWFYDYDPTVDLLITLDPASIGEADANPKPIAWSHEFEGGRVFYTAMGHTIDSWTDPVFLEHLAGGIRWALAAD